jgi:hypothetical protein
MTERPFSILGIPATLCLLFCGFTIRAAQSQASGEGIYFQKIRTLHSAEEFKRLTGGKVSLHRQNQWKRADGGTLIGTRSGVILRNAEGATEPFPGNRALPWNEITVVAEERPGIVWLGTTRGAIRLDVGDKNELEYFAGRRWLSDDRVKGLGFDNSQPGVAVWIETDTGFSRVSYSPMTLEQKAKHFEDRVRARHVRHGFTADSRLLVPGDLTSSRMISSDNDGLWTAMYVAAECFRFKVTGDSAARDFARQGIQAMMRLESITGIRGFPARSFIKPDTEAQPKDGEWHATADGAWKWKGDTSSDEIVGHYLGYAVYYDLVADEAEKKEISALVDRITTHILDHGYHLFDLDGKPTRWGWWAPDEIWTDPDETGLRALHILSHLKVAEHITNNPRYTAAYDELVTRHRYAQLTRNQKINIPGRINHSDDELAFLSYYPLLRYETDAGLRALYTESLERSWQCERAERNPLWNYIYAAGTGDRNRDAAESVRTLRRIPWDLVSWPVMNSHRLDVTLDPVADRFKQKQSLLVLPPDERPQMKWNGNPYAPDGGGSGKSEDDGAFFLLPYWMGRYHGFIRN